MGMTRHFLYKYSYKYDRYIRLSVSFHRAVDRIVRETLWIEASLVLFHAWMDHPCVVVQHDSRRPIDMRLLDRRDHQDAVVVESGADERLVDVIRQHVAARDPSGHVSAVFRSLRVLAANVDETADHLHLNFLWREILSIQVHLELILVVDHLDDSVIRLERPVPLHFLLVRNNRFVHRQW
ncbi:hypothetical protein PMAYCL1PPCAC_05911 [Pristionchus mayeri]|uniref:Uncharacterized protein n=1 Tax=Pristionchus mayeri TaxID=1317129 RepID=A0AAN4Z7V2_9BILA|nr:hypothetical protein PMAYCL1PPCAC_05911 [Pristionchus mayeri]